MLCQFVVLLLTFSENPNSTFEKPSTPAETMGYGKEFWPIAHAITTLLCQPKKVSIGKPTNSRGFVRESWDPLFLAATLRCLE